MRQLRQPRLWYVARNLMRVACALAVLLAQIGAVRADDSGPPIRLVTFGDPLPLETLRAELMRELHRSVRIAERADEPNGAEGGAPEATLTITWHPEERELAVAFDEPGRGTVSRIVVSSGEAEETARVAALLASSLIRNEVDAMLGKRGDATPPSSPLPTEAPPAPPPLAEPSLPTPEPPVSPAERNQGLHPLVWGASEAYVNAGIKLAASHVYVAIALHYLRLKGTYVNENVSYMELPGGNYVGVGGFVGVRISGPGGFSADIDAGVAFYPAMDSSSPETVGQARVRLLAVGEIAEHFRLFAGVAAVETVRGLSEQGRTAISATPMPEVLGGIEF